MNRTSLLSVTGLAVILAIAAGIAVSRQQYRGDLDKGEKLFASLPSQMNTVSSITVRQAGQEIRIVKQQDGWSLPDKGNFPARTELVRQVLAGLSEMETVEAKTARPDLHSRLSLEEPISDKDKSLRLTLRNSTDAVLADVIIGKKRTGSVTAANSGSESAMLYVRKADSAQTWLVAAQLDPRSAAIDWINRDILDIALEDVTKVTLTAPDQPEVKLSRTGDAKDFTVESVPDGRKAKSGWDVNSLATALETLNFEDVQPAAKLTVPAETARGRYETKDGTIITVSLVPQEKDIWALFKIDGDSEQAKQLAAKTKDWAYRLPDYKRDRIQKKLDDLLEPQENTTGG
jgi:hypothetical protein